MAAIVAEKARYSTGRKEKSRRRCGSPEESKQGEYLIASQHNQHFQDKVHMWRFWHEVLDTTTCQHSCTVPWCEPTRCIHGSKWLLPLLNIHGVYSSSPLKCMLLQLLQLQSKRSKQLAVSMNKPACNLQWWCWCCTITGCLDRLCISNASHDGLCNIFGRTGWIALTIMHHACGGSNLRCSIDFLMLPHQIFSYVASSYPLHFRHDCARQLLMEMLHAGPGKRIWQVVGGKWWSQAQAQ